MMKSQTWLANFDLSLMELRRRSPAALVGCSHNHQHVRGKMKVMNKTVSIATFSGAYTPELATMYARCV